MLLLLACATTVGPPEDLDGPPVLPAPEAPLYAAAPGEPTDGALKAALRAMPELRWDESLSGAAAGVALRVGAGEAVDDAVVRWAAWRAGWMWPVDRWVVGLSEEAAQPPPEVAAALQGGGVIGLARARGAAGEAWVVLRSTPEVGVAAFPRAWRLDDTLRLEVTDPGWSAPLLAAMAPSGRLVEAGVVTLDETGEWLVQATSQSAEGVEARLVVPVYVEVEPPERPPVAFGPAVGRDAERSVDLAWDVLDALRAPADLPVLASHPLLEAAARSQLAGEPMDVGRVQGLGFSDGGGVTCAAPTVVACIEPLAWTLEHRPDLLGPGRRWGGVAAVTDPRGVRISVVLGDE